MFYQKAANQTWPRIFHSFKLKRELLKTKFV